MVWLDVSSIKQVSPDTWSRSAVECGHSIEENMNGDKKGIDKPTWLTDTDWLIDWPKN